MKTQALLRRAVQVLAPLVLAGAQVACGDSPADAEPPAADVGVVPASAIATPRAYTGYAASLPVNDRAPPLDLGDWSAPTSETDAPEPVG